MRIQGGQKKGKKLSFVPRSGLRPTSAKVREAVFDILAAVIKGAHFLDLYAGTGAIGIEALSRGASLCVLVEANKKNAQLIKINLRDIPGESLVLAMSVQKALVLLERKGLHFDIVYLDPPYGGDLLVRTLEQLKGADCLDKDAIILAEHSSRERVDIQEGLEVEREYRYGDTALTLLSRKRRG